ncbi:conjugal transfer protein TraH [Vibrio sp. 10N.222.54.A1]|jgi:conjugative transfer pilus assembly protein TraH|uniref:conjugal transfer protein TraH n=1 Tax=unclassified Vibrio TaxID=2614977 RepID=UPI00354F5950
MNKTILLKTTAISVLFASMPYSALASNAISKQMDDAFGSLSNTTSAKSYETAQRGVFSGGQIFIRNQTKRVTPVTVTAPSFSAGCGGIDIYGGSFSFINADQMIETFQAIGSNALGYGIKLAVQAGCPTCEQVMTSLEKTAQAINSMNIDSCQAAQGIVDATASFATTSQADAESKTSLTNSGFTDDFNKAWSWASEESSSPTEALKTKNPTKYAKEITGNLTWRSLQSSDAKTVFGGNDQFLELVMTMVGSVIVKNPDSSDKEADPKLIKLNGYGLTLAELIEGGDYNIYACDSKGVDECLNPPLVPSQTISDVGLKSRISDSLIEVFNNFQADVAWSQTAKDALSFKTLAGSACLDKIYAAAYSNAQTNVAQQIADLCAGRMALEASYYQVESYIRTTRSALANAGSSDSQQSAKQEANKILEESAEKYRQEFEALNNTYPAGSIYLTLNSIKFRTTKGDTLLGGE